MFAGKIRAHTNVISVIYRLDHAFDVCNIDIEVDIDNGNNVDINIDVNMDDINIDIYIVNMSMGVCKNMIHHKDETVHKCQNACSMWMMLKS